MQKFHPFISELEKRYSVSIVDRNAWETFMYDGKTIASYYDMSISAEEDEKCEKYNYTDFDYLHEFGHVVAAKPEQLDLPEFAMSMGIVNGSGFGVAGGEFRNKDYSLKWNMVAPINDGLIDRYEQDVQEFLAQRISVYWGRKHNIPFDISKDRKFDKSSRETLKSWDDYHAMKNDELLKSPKHLVDEVNRRWEELQTVL